MMETEIKELYQSQLIEPKEYEMALLILRQEIQALRDHKKDR